MKVHFRPLIDNSRSLASRFLTMLLCIGCYLAAAGSISAQLAFQSLQDFPWSLPPSSNLVSAPDGYFYGLTRMGGALNGGTIYRIAPGLPMQVVHHFASVESGWDPNVGGTLPEGNFVLAADGCLYGTTRSGGTHGQGVIFKYDPVTTTFFAVHHFATSDGVANCVGILLDGNGDLIGTTSEGGGEGGSVFRFTLQGEFSVIHEFERGWDTNSLPAQILPWGPGSLICGRDRLLYGTADGGLIGQNPFFPGRTYGTIFRVEPSGSIQILHAFSAAEGAAGSFVEGPDGHFYGKTSESYNQMGVPHKGTFYRLTKEGTYTTLHTLPVDQSEGWMLSGLFLGSDGAFYASTYYGGDHDGGVIQRYTADGGFSIVHHFDREYRGAERSGMIESGGFLYGILNGSNTGSAAVRALQVESDESAQTSGEFTRLSAPVSKRKKAGAYRLKIDPTASDNDAPVTRSEVRVIPRKVTALKVGVLANDRDPERDPLKVVNVSASSAVVATIEPSERHLRIEIPAPLTSSETVTYTVSDGNGGFSDASVLLRPKLSGRYRCTLTGDTGSGAATFTVGATGAMVGTVKIGNAIYRVKGRLDRNDKYIGVARTRSGASIKLNLTLAIGSPNTLVGLVIEGEKQFAVSPL